MKKSFYFTCTFTIVFFLLVLPEAKSQYADGVIPDSTKISTDLVPSKSLLFANLSMPENSVRNIGFLETRTSRSVFLLGKIFINNRTDAPHSFKSFYPETVTDFTSGFHFYRQYNEFPILNN